MAWVEHKRDKQEPLYLNSGSRQQTSAEIVADARRSLRTLGTRRPFTPRDEHRHLFGDASACARDGRPLSAFSLHAKSFEAPDSRPSSGTHLSPLEHKPRLPLSLDEDCRSGGAGVPKPPAERMDRATGRAKHRRACSLSRMHTMTDHSNVTQTKGCDEHSKWSVDPCQQGNRENPKPECRTEPLTHPEPLSHPPTKHSGVPRSSSVDLCHAKGPTTTAAGGHADATGTDGTYKSDFWNMEVLPVLQIFEAVVPGGTAREETVENLCSACDHLYHILSEKGMLGRQFKNRSSVLRALFGLIDLGSDQLNLTLAKLILGLNVSGNNLLNICKLIFKISRNPSNDFLFQNNSIIDSILLLLQGDDVYKNGEAVLYSMGTLKLLSGNSALSRLLLDKDFIPVLLRLSLKLLQTSDRSVTRAAGHGQHATSGHILVQLTAALRNMADVSESRSIFLANDVFSTLCMVMDHYQNDQDICLNSARIFSKLSSYAECCYALAETSRCYSLFLELLSRHSRKQDLVVRLLFTLGNLTARSDKARERLYEEEGAIEILLDIFQIYQQASLTLSKTQDLQSSFPKEEDILIKLIRVLANLAIYPNAGTALAANTLCVNLLLEVMEVSSVEDNSELVVNSTATINNLSYYQEESSVVRGQHKRISELLLRSLLTSNMDAVLEVTRVFGNLSQIRSVRQFIFRNKVHQFMVTLLDSKNPDVCFSACGVLVNLSVDLENRGILREEGTVHKLIDCLRDFGLLDWQLAGLACQTLWNCDEGGEQQYTQELLEILSLYSDHEALQWPSSHEAKQYQEACWELEFLPVAQRLKKRIQSHGTLLEPITDPS